jgi:hypothetical protein
MKSTPGQFLILVKTSNDTRYEQNAWQWSKGGGAKENVLHNKADGAA